MSQRDDQVAPFLFSKELGESESGFGHGLMLEVRWEGGDSGYPVSVCDLGQRERKLERGTREEKKRERKSGDERFDETDDSDVESFAREDEIL